MDFKSYNRRSALHTYQNIRLTRASGILFDEYKSNVSFGSVDLINQSNTETSVFNKNAK